MVLYESQLHRDGIIELMQGHINTPRGLFNAVYTFEMWPNEAYVEVQDGTVVGLVTYFRLPIEFDVIMAMHRDNKFTTGMFRKLYDMIIDREKEIRISSDSSNKPLQKILQKYGGDFEGDVIVFPKLGG